MSDNPVSIGQIHISVDDVDRAVAWYRDVLGLEFLFQVPGQPMAFFNCGGVRLYLGRPEDETFRSRPVLYYRVDEIDRAVLDRKRSWWRFTDPTACRASRRSPPTLDAGLRDPEGNPVISWRSALSSE